MQIIVNAKPHEIKSNNLDAALNELGFAGSAVATAVNGTFVARGRRSGIQLAEGDRLEVLAPMQGG